MKMQSHKSGRGGGRKVTIVEVGTRDGLQNEKTVLTLEQRLEFAVRLAEAGVREIELGAFVSPQWVPQMAGSAELMKRAFALQAQAQSPLAHAVLSALVPNPRGMEDSINVGVRHVAIFGSASEIFSKKNINCSIEESFSRFIKVMEMARAHDVKVRGYLSMCFGCPFEGEIPEGRVVRLAKRLMHMGVDEISIGDTIGIANPAQVRSLVSKLIDAVGAKRLAMHFHDTRGTALANVLASLDLGIRTFDSSLGGLGGCPYAPAATGNLATEDVVFMLHGMGYETGIDLAKLPALNKWIAEQVGHELPSRVGKAGLPRVLPA
jgi:hydroxymethylglutaryl-CoA lyase